MTRRASSEAGFTLVELLVSMMLSLIVTGAAFGLVSTTERASKTVRDRVDSSQRGRLAMERITQELRAMACPEPVAGVGAPSPILAASNDSITFYVNLVDRTKLSSTTVATQNSAFDSEKRALTVVRDAAGLPTSIREDRWSAGESSAPVSRTLVSDIRALRGPRPNATTPGTPLPVFAYFAYTADPAATPTEFAAATPLTDDVRRQVSQVRVSFEVRPTEPRSDDRATAGMQNSVYARTFTNQRGSVSTGSAATTAPSDRFFQCQ